jgi:hypothetical protein
VEFRRQEFKHLLVNLSYLAMAAVVAFVLRPLAMPLALRACRRGAYGPPHPSAAPGAGVSPAAFANAWNAAITGSC